MIDFLYISISNSILIFLLLTVLVFFCLYIYDENKKLKEQVEELRKENKSLLEKKIISQVDVDTIAIKNISNEKRNDQIKTIEEPITITKDSIPDYSYENKLESSKIMNFNPNEFINNPPKESQSNKEKSYDYLQEISKKIESELKPQTIELTDYEKKQEEQAVISYKELLKHKDNVSVVDDKQETINFIEELKKLRNSLK